MRAISDRIRRLERTLGPQASDDVEGVAVVLDARRRRRLEAAGQPFEPQPRRSRTFLECRKLSLTDVLSGRYRDKAAR